MMLPRSQVNAVAHFHLPERDMVKDDFESTWPDHPGAEHWTITGSTAAAARHHLTGCHGELVAFRGEIWELLDLATENNDYPDCDICIWRVPLETLRTYYRYRSVMEGRSEHELAKEGMERYLNSPERLEKKADPEGGGRC